MLEPDVYCTYICMHLQKGVEWDHLPDSVQLIMGSPKRTKPSLQLYWTVSPTKCLSEVDILPLVRGRGGGHSTAVDDTNLLLANAKKKEGACFEPWPQMIYEGSKGSPELKNMALFQPQKVVFTSLSEEVC